MTSDLIERVARAFRAEEKLNWNLELGNDDDVADLARIAIAAMQANTAEQAAELAKFKALAETLAGAVREIKDSWDWWQVDTYDRCSSVVEDAINEALREYKEATNV